MRSLRPWVAAAAFAALSLDTGSAHAAPVKGRVRLGLELVPLAVINETLDFGADLDLDGDDDVTEVDELIVGVTPGFGVNLGYALSEHVVLGARLQLSSTTSEQSSSAGGSFGEDDDLRTVRTTVLMLPYLMYVGGSTESAIRFSISAMFGGSSIRSKNDSFDQTIGGYALGGTLGFLSFPAERFSIDPSVFVLYQSGTGSDEDDLTDDFDYSSTTFGVMVTFSGWLGGRSGEPPTMARDIDDPWQGRLPPRAERARVAPPKPAISDAKVITTRTTLDSAIFMLLGAPERADSPVAVRIQRYAPAGEAPCQTLDIEVDGAVVATVPITQKSQDNGGIEEITVQGLVDLALAERMAKGPTKLRWCGNERTLSLQARDGISRFIVTMRSRIAAKPPAPATAPVQPAPQLEPAPTPAPAPDAAAPSPIPATPQSATPY